MRALLPKPLFVATIAAGAPAQATWIVDAAGGGNFTQIGPAFDAAAPGDTILVRPGSYLGFARDPAKGVRILGDGAGVVVTSPISLSGLPHGEHLQLGGFRIDATNNAVVGGSAYGTRYCASALELARCGNVALSELELFGPHGSVLPAGLPFAALAGLSVYGSGGVASGVRARSGDGAAGGRGGAGLSLDSSAMALSGCSFEAGSSGQPGAPPPLSALVVGGFSTAAIDECAMVPGSAGGLALEVTQSRVLLANHTGVIQGQVALGSGPLPLEYDGPVIAAPWSLPLTPRAQPGLLGPGSVARGGAIVWTVHGGAGSSALVVASLGTQPLTWPSLVDTTLFTATLPSSAFLGIATVGAGGSTTLSLAVPNLPFLANEHVALQVVGWIGQPTWKASGVALTRVR